MASPKRSARGVTDITEKPDELQDILLLAAQSGSTLKGQYMAGNKPIGIAISLSVPQADGSNTPVRLPNIPSSATWFRGRTNDDLIVAISVPGDEIEANFKTAYDNYGYERVGNFVGFGAVPISFRREQAQLIANQTSTLLGNIAGQAADGVAVAGNPVRIAGKDGGGLTQDIITDSDGHVQVDILSGTVTGTFSATGPAADGAAVSGNPVRIGGKDGGGLTQDILTDSDGNLQVDVLTLPAIPAGTNNIGDVDVLSIAAGDNNIGNVDIVTQPARVATTDSITAKLATDLIQNGLTALTPKFAVIDAATSGDNTLVAAVASKKIRVLSLWLVASAAVNTRFESGASGTALTGQANLAANGGIVLPFNPVGWFETASNTLLNLELSGAVSCDGNLTYVEV